MTLGRDIRYLGTGTDEVGPLSLQAKRPERISSIFAVLSETDVINMVSRGICASDIVKGIHLILSDRMLKMLSGMNAEYPVLLTGGMTSNVGLLSTLKEAIQGGAGEIRGHIDGIYAGSLGAAILGGYRHLKLHGKRSDYDATAAA